MDIATIPQPQEPVETMDLPGTDNARASATSMISIALSDSDASLGTSTVSASDLSVHTATASPALENMSAIISDEESPWAEERSGSTATETSNYSVPSLPSPSKKRSSTSRHVRAKSSLQEPEMAALLARLELENNAIAKDPKAGIATIVGHSGPGSTFEYHVRDTICSSLTMVTIPEEALGMSLGDFWALVTKDYSEALHLLPTMTPLMIHKGVPDFLRSAVWVGIAGARDAALQVEFESLCERLKYEKLPNEHIINKDLARCFPHHEMFRDPEGEGQKTLGTVLKCYSLYDTEIGYCQGMAFVAGALLMNMPSRDAFCVFVRLMENHGLRSLYSPSLSGLHSRTFQLKKLLAQISPNLLKHLGAMNFELAYVSQYFMTLFATSCPLNVLFRIYDVVFAEGADETMMRVALALILSNEHKLMAMTELEQILQTLLGRQLWEPYVSEPDFLMDEIARLSNVVTKEELDKIGQEFSVQTSGDSRDTVRALGFGSSLVAGGFVAGGFRLFEHFRTPSSSKPLPVRSTSSNNLLESKGHEPRRSVSKRSVITIDSSVGSGSESLMSAESRTSTMETEYEPEKPAKASRNKDDRSLHEQVEGLLLALTEIQKEAAETAAQLQVEHRRKASMAEIVFRLKDLIIHKEQVKEEVKRERRKTMPSRSDINHARGILKDLHRKSNMINSIARSASLNNLESTAPDAELEDSLTRLCTLLETESNPNTTPKSDVGSFFSQTNASPAPPSISEPEFRPERVKRKDSVRFSIYGGLSQQSSNGLPVKKTSNSTNSLWPGGYNAEYLAPISSVQTPDTTTSEAADYWPEVSMFDPSPELGSAPFPKRGSILHPRTSSLTAREVLAVTTTSPSASQDEALLLELVNAKTREATAIHERDEMKVQNDKLRKQADLATARELEINNKLVEMERLLKAQQQATRALQEAHTMELARHQMATEMQAAAAAAKAAKAAKAAGTPTKQNGLLSLTLVPDNVNNTPTERSGSLWPGATTTATPAALSPASAAEAASGAWNWLAKKSRSVSTSSTA